MQSAWILLHQRASRSYYGSSLLSKANSLFFIVLNISTRFPYERTGIVTMETQLLNKGVFVILACDTVCGINCSFKAWMILSRDVGYAHSVCWLGRWKGIRLYPLFFLFKGPLGYLRSH